MILDRVQVLNRMPIEIPPDVAIVYLGRNNRGRAVLLGSANNINKLPKSLRAYGQVVFPFWEQSGEQLLLVRSDGSIYLVAHT